ncbi:YdeI/OmpD-associated family protein [Modestobacter sp. SYSU DS0511]
MADDGDLPVLSFATAADFDAWLAAEHDRAPGLFLKLARKSSGIPSITAPEAVEVALCHGWIDGRSNRRKDPVPPTPRKLGAVP